MRSDLGIAEKMREAVRRRIRVYPVRSNRASSMGHPCLRYLVLSRTSWSEMVPHDEDKQQIFDEGNIHEAAVLRELEDSGVRVIEQQVALDWKQYEITGHIDGLVRPPDQELLIPLEIKSCSDHAYHRLANADNLMYELQHGPWYWKNYPAQLLLYCLMKNKPYAVWIFKNKLNGDKSDRRLELEPNLDYAEGIIKRAEEVNLHLSMGTLPACHDEWSICEECGFLGKCHPDNVGGTQLVMLSELEYYLELREQLKAQVAPAKRELEMVEDEIKLRLKKQEGMVLAGLWRGSPKTIKVSAKAAYEYTKWNWKKIEDEKKAEETH